MSFDDTSLKFHTGPNSFSLVTLRSLDNQLNELGYKIVNRDEYDRYMRHQLKVLSTLSQQYRGYDAED